MTNKELLELAAKAAGISFNWVKDWAGNEGVGIDGDGRTVTIWNPLTDDGDALRLAVKLEMRDCCDSLWVIDKTSPEEYRRDPHSATRRAIVRAAAEIGKGKDNDNPL